MRLNHRHGVCVLWDFVLEASQTPLDIREMTHVSEDHTPLLVHVWLVVVVDLEAREQDLILVRGQGPLGTISAPGVVADQVSHNQFLLRLLGRHTSLLDQSPEGGVVEIVDVTSLSQRWTRKEETDVQSTCRQLR